MSDPNDKTRLIRRSSSGNAGTPVPPVPLPAQSDPEATVYGGGGAARGGYLDQTRIIRRDEPGGSGPTPVDDGKTKLVRPSSRSAAGETVTPSDDLPEGPVVGWLVVVEGLGRGKSVTLGYGMNPIGREPGNRVCLPFGDTQISRIKHATLTYDPRGRQFFIQHGESTNLTYVGEQPVLAPVMLNSGDLIRLGDTTVLKFIPLCGDDFNWD